MKGVQTVERRPAPRILLVSDELHRQLKIRAAQLGVNMQKAAEEAVKLYLAKKSA